ncbi:MAG: type 2 periplasmic-binding domain-containing protein [Sulfuricurvum sp.]
MPNLKYLLYVILLALSLSGCFDTKPSELRIAISPWIGYSPFYYADAMGWLHEENIHLIETTSLHESKDYFEAGLVDAFLSTQYEASSIQNMQIIHLLPIDRSNGGDVVLSNNTLQELLTKKEVKAYLEIDSVNKVLLDEFVKNRNLDVNAIQMVHKGQSAIGSMVPSSTQNQLLVTYEPYATLLRHQGFIEVASTRESGLLILDSLYTSSGSLKTQKERYIILSKMIKKAHDAYKRNPKAYYETIKAYVEYANFEEFNRANHSIQFILDLPKAELTQMLKAHHLIPLEQDM